MRKIISERMALFIVGIIKKTNKKNEDNLLWSWLYVTMVMIICQT